MVVLSWWYFCIYVGGDRQSGKVVSAVVKHTRNSETRTSEFGENNNNNNRYLYSALSCVTQSAVTKNECNTI